ncbi:MAG: hypothetical protein L6R40_005295 [Gallowayella cf. fulva]|nr:MAG: hypothetical protein L6R40_005295 [Xanthomendoza cf. fulva]
MPEGLPEGLFTTNVEVRRDLESVDRVDVEDIARLWKAYHTNRALFAEDVGRRLENFFWRIWGNNRLLHNITGTLVAAIFSKISEGGYIRTTPTQSPRSSRSLGTFQRPQQAERTNISSNLGPPSSLSNDQNLPIDDNAGDAEETETESTVSNKKKPPPRPPPILKKPKSNSPPEGLHGTEPLNQAERDSGAAKARESSPSGVVATRHPFMCKDESRSLGRSGKTARFSTDEVSLSSSVSRPTPARADVTDVPTDSQGKDKPLPSRRKAAVVASTGASRRRPVMRQRSSQSSSSSASMAAPSQSIGGETQFTSEPIDVHTATESNRQPVSKQQALHLPDMDPDARTTAEVASFDPAKKERTSEAVPKVEAGSRTIPHQTSFPAPPSILKKSFAAAASASYQATGRMDLDQPVVIGGKHISSRASTGIGNQREGSDEDELQPRATSKEQALPRTKSQLTMLLQRDRTSRGDQ